MNLTRTRALVFGALMAAMMVVITALGTLLGLPLPFLLPLPVALAILRYGTQYGLMTGAVATFLTFLFFGMGTAVFMPLFSGLLPGLVLGLGLNRGWSPSRTATLMAGTLVLGSLTGLLSTFLIMGQNPLDLMARIMQETTASRVEWMEKIFPNPTPQQQEALAAMRALAADAHRVLRLVLPAGILGGAGLSTIATYQVAVWIFPRFGHGIPGLPLLTHWSFPRWLLWVFPPVILGLWLPQVPEVVKEPLASVNMALQYAFLIQGYFVVNWYLARHWPSKARPWLLLFSPFLLGQLAMLVFTFAGLLDLGLELRRRSESAASPTPTL